MIRDEFNKVNTGWLHWISFSMGYNMLLSLGGLPGGKVDEKGKGNARVGFICRGEAYPNWGIPLQETTIMTWGEAFIRPTLH